MEAVVEGCGLGLGDAVSRVDSFHPLSWQGVAVRIVVHHIHVMELH